MFADEPVFLYGRGTEAIAHNDLHLPLPPLCYAILLAIVFMPAINTTVAVSLLGYTLTRCRTFVALNIQKPDTSA